MYGQVQKMFDDGVLKAGEDGSYVPVVDPAESEYLRSKKKPKTKRQPMTEEQIDKVNQDLDKMEHDDLGQ